MAGVKRKFSGLAFYCDQCGGGVFSDDGYLTVTDGRWKTFHDACRLAGKSSGGTTPALALGSSGNHEPVRRNGEREIVVRISRVSTYPLLLTTLANLAESLPGISRTNWPKLLCRVVADSEWFDSEGTKTQKEINAENHAAYTNAGFNSQLGAKDREV